ncbi:thioredoxin-like domain-containing protein [Carboxylicivirga sp. RSCT41]|uniref:thioredoxin-like domain-containing protein n=1 Tax=Carboxylicivirga agarovorans TaxID=3417570 RepID=UPI003D325666
MKILSIIIGLALMLGCQAGKADGYTIKGEIAGLKDGAITIGYYDHANQKAINIDSIKLVNGYFELTGRLDSPLEVRAMITPGNYYFSMWLENSEISIKADLAKAKKDDWGGAELPVEISGSVIQDEQSRYNAMLKPIEDELEPYGEAYTKANMAYMKGSRNKIPEEELKVLKEKAQAAYDAIKPFTARMNEVSIKYMDDNPSSYITASILSRQKSYMKLDEVKQRFEAFSEEIKESVIGQIIKAEIEKSMKGAAGSIAASFVKEDINGEQLSLEDFKGQYVLLDFWASWCKPCRAGNPHLISLYRKYHDKGIEFIGIASDDGNEAAWRKAVKEDDIGIWRHVLNGDRRKGESIGNDYAVHTLPTKILLNPEGQIIGRFAADGDNDEAMDKLFEELFGE